MKKASKSKPYEQKFRDEWLLDSNRKKWLDKTKTNSAYCKWCKCEITPKLSVITQHEKSNRHQGFVSSSSGTNKVASYFQKNVNINEETKRAELMITAFIVDHNIPFRVMDHLSEVLPRAFHDSAIAKEFACKRTKATCLAYNVLGEEFKTAVVKDIMNTKHFSVIIDESTDRSTTKSLAVAVKYFSMKTESVQTKLLNLIPVASGTAEDLFEMLSTELQKNHLSIENLIGFSADTTNVMFGSNNSIVTRIKEASPSCLVLKCVCHSTALSVSHASKVLPRSIDQLIRDIYNYFSQSAKRMDEFKEFQEFTDTPQHRILRFYDIRWLSLGACVGRILEQWSALTLFFQGQCLIDRIQASEKIAVELGCIFNKFYFTFLDFILYLTNKLNTLFQSQSPKIHQVYTDCISVYKSVVSCFLKRDVIRCSDSELFSLDPGNQAFHVELHQVYFGSNITKIMLAPAFTSKPAAARQEVLQRCKDFLVTLAKELKKRLPINGIMRDLRFLQPQVAISGEIASIVPMLENLPDIIEQELHQELDMQWRQMAMDSEVPYMLTGPNGESINVTEFWVNIDLVTLHPFTNLVGPFQNRSSFWRSGSVRKTKMAGIANTAAKIFVSRKLPDAALELLLASRHKVEVWPHPESTIPRKTLLEKVSGIDGLLCLLTEKVDSELLNAAGSQLKVVSTMSVGFDHVDCSELKKRNILLGNTPDVLTDATADLTMALLLATSRRLLEANKAAKEGQWGTWSPLWMCGSNLKDSTIGVFGLGRIGCAVSRRLKPFGVKEILYNQDVEFPTAAKDVGAKFVSMDELLQKSDFVLACCALTDQTRGMFNKNVFSKMKNTAIFINTSRGDVVNQADLVEALQNGNIKAAGLDVTTPEPLPTDHPLFKMDNAVVLPHIGSAEEKTRTAMAVLAAKNLLAALDGTQMPAEVKLYSSSL